MFALGSLKKIRGIRRIWAGSQLVQKRDRASKLHKFISVLPGLYGELAWNIMKQIEEGKN